MIRLSSFLLLLFPVLATNVPRLFPSKDRALSLSQSLLVEMWPQDGEASNLPLHNRRPRDEPNEPIGCRGGI